MSFQRQTNQFHRFSIVVNELKSAETVPHKTAVLTFVNTIINCNKDLTQRCKMRNQLIGNSLTCSLSLFMHYVHLWLESVYHSECE